MDNFEGMPDCILRAVNAVEQDHLCSPQLALSRGWHSPRRSVLSRNDIPSLLERIAPRDHHVRPCVPRGGKRRPDGVWAIALSA